MSEAKERPIIFSGDMVRAIREGRKTQMRRVVKPQPGDGEWLYDDVHCALLRHDAEGFIRCPYGGEGDRLWVRENGWQRPSRTKQMLRDGADTWEPYYYDADGLTDQDRAEFKAWGFQRRPSIHMPRWASRILLEVMEVRVQRLLDISEADAMAEGYCFVPDWPINAKQWFQTVWEAIHGAGSWHANPLVWVITFWRGEA